MFTEVVVLAEIGEEGAVRVGLCIRRTTQTVLHPSDLNPIDVTSDVAGRTRLLVASPGQRSQRVSSRHRYFASLAEPSVSMS